MQLDADEASRRQSIDEMKFNPLSKNFSIAQPFDNYK